MFRAVTSSTTLQNQQQRRPLMMGDVVDLVSDGEDDTNLLRGNAMAQLDGVPVIFPPSNRHAVMRLSNGRVSQFEKAEPYLVIQLSCQPMAWSRAECITRFVGTRLIRNVVDKNKAKKKRLQNLVKQQLNAKWNIREGHFPMFPVFPITLVLEFHRAIPKKDFVGQNRGNELRKGRDWYHRNPHTYCPDVDNMAKLVLDSLQGIVYKDDKQVVKVTTTKSWDLHPPHTGRTIIKFGMAEFGDFSYFHETVGVLEEYTDTDHYYEMEGDRWDDEVVNW